MMEFDNKLFKLLCDCRNYLMLGGLCLVIMGDANAQCVANFTYTMDSTNTVAFTNTSTNFDTASVVFAWNFGDGNSSTAENPTHTYIVNGTYTICLAVNDSGCADSLCQTIVIGGDSIWPGDANNDGIVNYLDIFPIGIAFGSQGVPRDSIDISWSPKLAFDWNTSFADSTDYKYADCNGDGMINADDTTAIFQNYHLTHSKSTGRAPCDPGNPPLFFNFPSDSVSAGDTVMGTVHYGDATDSAKNVYALGFTIDYDPSLIKAGSFAMDFTGWLGGAQNSLDVIQDFPGTGTLEAGFTRTDHNAVSGRGAIASFIIVMEDDLSGSAYLGLNFGNEVKAIGPNEQEMEVCAVDKEVSIVNAVKDPDHRLASVKIYPNPTAGTLNIMMGALVAENLEVANVLGQTIRVEPVTGNQQQIRLAVSGLEAGMYLLKIRSESGAIVRKFNILR